MSAVPDESSGEATLSEGDLRARSSEVLREVEAGSSFVITDDGRPVARLVPLDRPRPARRVSRPATRAGGFVRPTFTSDLTTAEVLDELREERL